MKTHLDHLALEYDLLYADLEEDIPFWIEKAHQCNGKILEIGCGTGRITIPIAKSNVYVTGIDISSHMLKILKKKSLQNNVHIDTHLMDMRALDLKELFNLIIVPYRGFQHLLTITDQEQSLISMRKTLNANGHLIINLFPPNIEMFDQNKLISYESKTIANNHKQEKLTIRHRVQVDPETQNVSVDLFTQHQNEGIIFKEQYFEYTLSYLYEKEAEYLFRNCGYQVIDLYGDYNRGPYQSGSADMIWVLEKTG